MTPGTGPPDPDLPELEIQLSFRAGFIAFIARWWHIPEAFAKSEVQIALARKHLVSPGIHFTTGVRSKKENLSLRFPGEPKKKWKFRDNSGLWWFGLGRAVTAAAAVPVRLLGSPYSQYGTL